MSESKTLLNSKQTLALARIGNQFGTSDRVCRVFIFDTILMVFCRADSIPGAMFRAVSRDGSGKVGKNVAGGNRVAMYQIRAEKW